MCRIRNFFVKYNYGIIHSRLEQKYLLHTKIASNVLYHITRDSKVKERISMHINMYNLVYIGIKMWNYLASNPNNYVPMPLNIYVMIVNAFQNVFIAIYMHLHAFIHTCMVCTIIKGIVMQRDAFLRFWSKAIMAFWQ